MRHPVTAGTSSEPAGAQGGQSASAEAGAMLSILGALAAVRTAASPARDTLVPCGGWTKTGPVDPVNVNATFHITSTAPPYVLCLREGQAVDEYVKRHGRWMDCDPLQKLMRREKGVFVDVGANIGTCSMMMASLGHRVVSFEPTPPTFVALAAALAGTAPSPSWDVRLVNAGVSNESGAAVIQTQPGNAGGALTTGRSEQGEVHSSAFQFAVPRKFAIHNGWQKYQISLTTLDEAVHEHVDLMKLDCQGHELRALQGGWNLINNLGVDIMRLEFFPTGIRQVGDDPVALLRFLDEAGYRLFTQESETTHPVPPSSFAQFAHKFRDGYIDLVAYASERRETKKHRY